MAAKDQVEFGRCPQCEKAKLKRKGENLVCSSKNCDFTEPFIGKKSMTWLSTLREDSSLWKRSYFNDYPTPLSHEYRRLYLMTRRSQVFCLVYQIKDMCEVLLKFPVLCAAAYLKDDEITKKLVEKLPSLGDWKTVCDKILDKSNGEYNYAVPQPLRSILGNIKKLFDSTNYINKRNEYIGHGAMGFEDNEEYRAYSESLLRAIAEHLEKTRSDYAKIKLFVGEQELLGWRKAELFMSDVSPVVTVNDEKIELEPFMLDKENGLFFFDSFNGRNKRGYWLNYTKGGSRRSFDTPYFANVYERTMCKPLDDEQSMEDAVSTVELNAALDKLNAASAYSEPKEMVKWLTDAVGDSSDGQIFHLVMERGMGKTAFCYALESGEISKGFRNKIADVKVCAYYCSQSQLRGVNNFANGVTRAVIGNLTDERGSFVRIDSDCYSYDRETGESVEWTPELRAKKMAEMLAFFRAEHHAKNGKGKLLLIIDGLDEIPADCAQVFEFLPKAEDMPKNCYILLTSRNTKTEMLAKHTESALKSLSVSDRRIVAPKDTDNIAAMTKYIAGKNIVADKKGRRKLNDKEISKVLTISGNTFLNLRIYEKLLEGGYTVDGLPKVDSGELIEHYLGDLSAAYGDKLYEEALRVLLVIATAQEPLTLREIAYLSGQGFVTLKLLTFVKDFGALVKTVRETSRGTQLTIASERYREYAERTFAAELSELTAEFVDMIRSEEPENYDEENFGTKVPDGLLYLAAYIEHYVSSYSSAEFKEMVTEAKLWKKVEDFGLAVNGTQDYRLRRKIDCYTGLLNLLGDTPDENYIAGARMNRANTYLRLARYKEALADYDKAIEIMERLFEQGKLHDENYIAMALMNRGLTYNALTHYDEALADYDRAIEIMERLWEAGKLHDENDIAMARMNRANTYRALTRDNEALADYDRAIEIRERLFAEGKLHDENDIATVRMNRAGTLDTLTRYDEALADYDRAIEIRERLFAQGKLHDENHIATVRMNRAITLAKLTRYKEALADYDRAIEISERLWEEGKLHDENYIATARMNRAGTLDSLTRYDEALADYDRAIEIMERLWEEGKLHDENDIATVRMNRAGTLDSLTRYDEALADYDRAIEISERLWEEGKLHDENDIAMARMNRAVTLDSLTRYDEALADYDRAIEIMERLWEEGKLHDENYIATARMNRAGTYGTLTRYDEALADYDRAIEISERLFEAGKLHDENDIARIYNNMAYVYLNMNEMSAAEKNIKKTVDIAQRVFAIDSNVHNANLYANVLDSYSEILFAAERYKECAEICKKALDIISTYNVNDPALVEALRTRLDECVRISSQN